MKVFGQLEKAQLENTTSDTASHPKGMITYRTDLNQAKVSNGTTYKLLIDEDSTQTLSNKTYASPSITGAITAAQTTTPANPASGSNKLYFKADGKLYTLDSSGNEAMVGSGTGGVKNLITNGNADDTSSSIFVPYADAASTRPVDGTGGSPTVTTSMTNSTPLDGAKSFLLTKPASNVQGQGWSVPFTVDPAYRAKSLKISVDYIVNSGTFVAGGSSTESDIIWYIYDVTNSQLIEPSNIKMFSNNSSISDKFEATFQSSATGSSYRLIAHVQSVSALAYELEVDNITVSPQTYVFGSPVTDWVSFTPTGAFTTNTTYTGRWRRVGDSAEIQTTISFSGATNAAGLTINLPSGLTIDTAKVTSTAAWVTSLGTAHMYDSGTRVYVGAVIYENTTSVRVSQSESGNLGLIDNATPFTYGFGDSISISYKVPIAGWSSSVQTSDSADTRVVACSYVRTTTQSVAPVTDTTVVYDSKRHDTHAAMNTSNGRFYAPVSGYYRISASLYWTTFTPSAGQFLQMHFRKRDAAGTSIEAAYKDSYTVNAAVSQEIALRADSMFYCNSGESLEVELYHNTGASRTTVAGINHVDIERVTGPSAIAASETVAAAYTTGAGNVLSTTTIVDFGTKAYDTHGAVTTGASWKFTAPISGKYLVTSNIVFSSSSYTAGNNAFVDLYKNGNLTLRISAGEVQVTGSWFLSCQGSLQVDLKAGDYIDLRATNERGATALFAFGHLNHIEITKVGN